METKETDRRARGVKRVDFSTLVEICGRSGDTPAFEAEAIELSGRGMQVRTDYLPDLGAPLVLRFDAGEQEAVVEGEVAWRRENDKGGEFGIKFTAIDSASVRVLREACAGTLKPTQADKPSDDDAPRRQQLSEPGTPVRLHIQGLGAPMKARVFESRAGRLHVGSQLEFLKVGRALELEEGDHGDKRAVEIDSVTVTIDPQTQIPQLIVSLCYDNDGTPEPSVVDGERDSRRLDPRHRPAGRDQKTSKDARRAAASAKREESEGDSTEAEDSDDEDRFDDEGEDLFKGRFAAWASTAGSAMTRGGLSAAKLGASATRGLASLFGSASQKVAQVQKDRNPRRTSATRSSVAASAKGVTRNGLKDRPRAQRPLHAKGNAAETPSRKKRVVFAGLALLVCASGAYPLFFARDEKRAPAAATQVVQAAPLPPVSAAAVLPLGSAFPAATVLDTSAQLAAGLGPLAVEVPLFGTQQLSTLEAAPLTPPPQAAIDELSMAKDQTFAQPVVPSLAKLVPAEAPEAEAAAEAATPLGNTVWQAGKMHLPIVHRLRLDAPGGELQGSDTPSGFSVTIPGRKVMETGAQIAKRDDRILSVNVKNGPAGAQVVFRFRKGVPGHKVRLRNDYIEFFVNSEE